MTPSQRKLHSLSLALICSGWIFPQNAAANIGESFGFGSRAAALASAVTAEAQKQDGYASFYNPALMPFGSETFTLSWGVIAMEPRFKPIENVVLANTYMAEATQIGSVDLNYRTTFGNFFGLTWRSESSAKWAAGLTAFLPLLQTAFMDTGEAFAPEYTLDRARTQRPQFNFAAARILLPNFSVGAGLQVAFSMTAKADISLQTDLAKPSNMRFTTSLAPKAVPYLGMLYAPEGKQGISGGLTLRFPSTSEAHMDLTSAVNLPATGSYFPFAYNSQSALYYDPLTIQLGAKLPWSAEQQTFLQLEHQAWRNFKTPVMTLTRDPQGAILSDSRNPEYEYRNILVPRVGHEASFGGTLVRLGYGYRPSILARLSTGAGNRIDPSRHMLQTGLGWEFRECFGTKTLCDLDLHAAYQHLARQHIDKTPADEAGSPTGNKVGSPGYDVGGKIYGGGVSLTLKI
ncbi:MAG TPA: hypothetical protein DCS07_17635 [Bdellovibrionales bacterium]|nr:MAG: hypothetical protein A2X97_08495 [Bdellovibrionales bacterium GWA1_52_35]HAR44424.1 hypothetical protein [Bdellovibrionales bacterium]HCM39774.1 hypothetical protein [Bdellovibrionales bacterium]